MSLPELPQLTVDDYVSTDMESRLGLSCCKFYGSNMK